MFLRLPTKIALWTHFHKATQQPRRTFNLTGPGDRKPLYHDGPAEATAPYRRCYIFLNVPDQPSSFPKLVQTPISRELAKRSLEWGSGISVNFSWMEHFTNERASAKQPASVYSYPGGRLDIPDMSLENMDIIEQQILNLIDGRLTEPTSMNVDVYVCTHAARDCRCGERGQQVYDALLRAVQYERHQDPSCCFAKNIRIGAVGHLGGHQYAANVLIFPHGEWLGCVKPEDAPWIVRKLIDGLKARGARPLTATERPFSMAHWRGRMGMTQDRMKSLYTAFELETNLS